MTPLEKLASLPDPDTFLKPGITLAQPELRRQARGALARPAERRARIAPGERIHQAFQLRQQFGLLLGQGHPQAGGS